MLHTSKFNSLQSFKAKFEAKRYIENNIRSKSAAQNLADFSPYIRERLTPAGRTHSFARFLRSLNGTLF